MRITNKRFYEILVSVILILSIVYTDVGFGLVGSSVVYGDTKTAGSSNKDKKDSKKKKRVYKNDNVKDKDTIFIDEALGFKGYHALDTLKKYFDANWNKGLHYNGAVYHGLNYGNVGTNINYNFATNMQYKYRDKAGYGYNCTGVVTSVMYYASKTEKSIPEFYDRLIEGGSLGKICNGFVWWNFINKYKVKKYCAGRVSNSKDTNKVLNTDKRIKKGYMIYFSPTVRGGDCHLGFYWGTDSKGNHMMRHSIWRGFEWSAAFPGARGTYDLYVIPLSNSKTGIITKTFNLKIKRTPEKKVVDGVSKTLSLKGDTYDFYTSRNKKKLSGKIVYKKVKERNKKESGKKSKSKKTDKNKGNKKNKVSKKKSKNTKKVEYKTILPMTLNSKGESTRTIKIKVDMVFKKGKMKDFYIVSIGGKELSKTRKFSKTLWMKERKKNVPKGYKYQNATYCLRVEKYNRKKVRLCLYKGNTDKKNLIKNVKNNLTIKVK
ncbi:hypothetical protein [Eubacterium sp.]|uniref:hypothetical protein n=1 Tax=Eubacterium sp. TaxID=142586 RepID=UPI0025DC6209|nr:hypothetical protein [Eubacterium sp.]MCR5630144.1 hypothetical protein [Eubacterium sp.]